MPSFILIALVVIAPLIFTAVMALPALTMFNGGPKWAIQIIGGITAIALWAGLHAYAIELHRDWGYGVALWNTLTSPVNFVALMLIGADKDGVLD